MLEMREVSKHYGREQKGKSQICVLDSVSLCLEEGKTLGLMGASGSGKSTLAKILLLLEPAEQGAVYWNSREVDRKNRRFMRQFRQDVQYISQHPESFLDPNWKIGKSIWESVQIYGLKDDCEEKLKELLRMVKLNEAILDRYPHQVSGGEIQRACLCRALLLSPKVLILDEATSMLDISVQAQILNSLKEIQIQKNLTYLFISHDKDVVLWFADKQVELCNGKLSTELSTYCG